jgi:aromatic ring-opening dioxygenase LigB subunit
MGETARADVLAYAAPTYYGMLVAEVGSQTAA